MTLWLMSRQLVITLNLLPRSPLAPHLLLCRDALLHLRKFDDHALMSPDADLTGFIDRAHPDFDRRGPLHE